jgi:hypothetical protein
MPLNGQVVLFQGEVFGFGSSPFARAVAFCGKVLVQRGKGDESMSDGNILACDLSDYNVPKLAAVKTGELSEGMLVEELEGSELVIRDVRVLR